MPYIWKLPEKVNKEFLDQFPELHPTVAQLLYNRGLKTQEQIDEFLNPDYSQDIHDPFGFKDMKKACELIYSLIEKKENITVYGDYDADGVSSAVILNSVLTSLGAKTDVYLPHREKEGYGLNVKAVEELASNGTKLVITCDCGISNVEEVSLAKDKGLSVIVTDHHAIPEVLPAADAIIHPQVEGEKYPFKKLAGGGVAFKLAQALIAYKKNGISDKEKEIQEKWLLDMVAISTVADMVPLLGENRTLLKYGLIVLKKTKRLGLQKMLEIANIDPAKIDARTIGYAIGPRINAAGRMDHANLAYFLLTEEDEEKAKAYASDINQSNLDRQRLTEQTVRQAKEQTPDLKDSLLTFYHPDWSAGLTGLVASRLLREFSRPVLVMTNTPEGQIVGSGRSINEFNITEGLNKYADLLNRFGGHPQACGFGLDKENLESFVSGMKDYAAKELKDVNFQSKLDVEFYQEFSDISWDLVDMVDKFQPFGHGNPEPLFMSEEILITDARRVGNDSKHWKLELVKDNKRIGAIAFGLGVIDIEVGDKIDIVYNLSINQWNGNRTIQLIIKDIKKQDEL
ncbi:single-stranded-DNA-specific exonuclease RecJ [Candidatus Parcubacteria bacterium]|nr:MAG: single-stranded-DNA-specific exonuclease RecJ [Candidatus Parcubacteria bacterium]